MAGEKEKDRALPSLLWAEETAGNHRTFFMPHLQLARDLKEPATFCKRVLRFASRCKRCACASVQFDGVGAHVSASTVKTCFLLGHGLEGVVCLISLSNLRPF